MKRLLAGALVMFGVVSSAHAQCSAYTNTMAIAEAVGENSLIIEYTLDNNADFIFYAVPGDAFGAWYVGESGAKEFKDWDEDENGTVVFTDDDGDICTIGCDGDGGITVLIEDEYQAKFTPAYFAVDASGSVTNAPPPVACSCLGAGIGNGVTCTPAACRNRISCKYVGTFPGTPSAWCTPPSGGGGGGGN